MLHRSLFMVKFLYLLLLPLQLSYLSFLRIDMIHTFFTSFSRNYSSFLSILLSHMNIFPLQSMLTNGFVNSVVTSIEKRYGLTSKESGAIASFYDVGVVLVLLQVSYFGAAMRRLRVFSFGMAILAFAAFLFALPHFTAGHYRYKTPVDPVCYRGKNSSQLYDSLCSQANSASNLNNYKWIFWLSHMLVGIGASPLYTLGTAYLDDNLTTESSPVFLGEFLTSHSGKKSVGLIRNLGRVVGHRKKAKGYTSVSSD